MKKILSLLILSFLSLNVSAQAKYNAWFIEYTDSNSVSTFLMSWPMETFNLTAYAKVNFGDGTSESFYGRQKKVQHQYTTSGWYNVERYTYLIDYKDDTVYRDTAVQNIPVQLVHNAIYPVSVDVPDTIHTFNCHAVNQTPTYTSNVPLSSTTLMINDEGAYILSGDSPSTNLTKGLGGAGQLFKTGGLHYVQLIKQYSDTAGNLVAESFDKKEIYVIPPMQPTVAISKNQLTNAQVRFNALVSAPGLDTNIHDEAVEWRFLENNNVEYNNSTSLVRNFTLPGKYPVTLTYYVKLKSTGDYVGVATVNDTIDVVANSTCSVDFDFSVGVASGAIQFTNNSNALYAQPVNLSYTWIYGDGNTSASFDDTHTYQANGNYSVSLIQNVEDASGAILCADTITKVVSVTSASQGAFSCSALFTVDTLNIGQNILTILNRSTPSIVDSSVANVSYRWDFGDGDSSHLPYPSHTYSVSGVYNLCLSINVTFKNGQTCYGSYCRNVGVDSLGNFIYKNGSAGFTINVINPATIGLKEVVKKALEIYPNPALDIIQISGLSHASTEFQLFDLSGRKLLNGRLTLEQSEINISTLPIGVYLIRFENNGSVQTQKIIKQ